MPISEDFAFLPCSAILYERSERQRTKVDTAGLRDSIKNNGVLNPIIITRDNTLIAGERRLTASLELNLPTIPIRYMDELDPAELQIIELEENLKRDDLHWRDATRAIGRIHELYLARSSEWTQTQTAGALGLSPALVSTYLRVWRAFSDPRIGTASGLAAAYNMLSKLDNRVADAALSDILEGGARAFGEGSAGQGAGKGIGGQAPHVAPPFGGLGIASGASVAYPTSPPNNVAPASNLESLLNEDFLKWAPHYTGPKFNFIHCDFPYGINAFDGSLASAGTASSADMGQGGVAERKAQLYDDSPDTYWALVNCLCANLDRLMSHSGHLMFWFSMKYYSSTLATFAKLAPDLVFNPIPLVWVKSDNRGVLPDAKRGPRQIYETALLASREDRLIVKAVSNAYSAPSDKSYHHSTKPEPVLRYFMTMLVDDTTQLLDPTCGSGSALRAAESLGARKVLGLEIDEDHFSGAQIALRKFRALRGAAGKPA